MFAEAVLATAERKATETKLFMSTRKRSQANPFGVMHETHNIGNLEEGGGFGNP